MVALCDVAVHHNTSMDAITPIGTDVLLSLVAQRLAQGRDDPFGNPVMSVALAITRLMDEGQLDDRSLAP